MADIVEQLRQAAQQIADEGHDGWGNTCTDAADEITRMRDQLHLAEVARAAQVEGAVQAAAGWRERANQLEAERDTCGTGTGCLYKEARIDNLTETVERLTAERDAAFAMSRCQCATDEACAELAKLRAQVAALEVDNAAEKLFSKQAMQAAQDMATQRDALEVDAVRYKYLRDVAWHGGSLIFYAERYGPEDWDAHIDAALAARKGAT